MSINVNSKVTDNELQSSTSQWSRFASYDKTKGNSYVVYKQTTIQLILEDSFDYSPKGKGCDSGIWRCVGSLPPLSSNWTYPDKQSL